MIKKITSLDRAYATTALGMILMSSNPQPCHGFLFYLPPKVCFISTGHFLIPDRKLLFRTQHIDKKCYPSYRSRLRTSLEIMSILSYSPAASAAGKSFSVQGYLYETTFAATTGICNTTTFYCDYSPTRTSPCLSISSIWRMIDSYFHDLTWMQRICKHVNHWGIETDWNPERQNRIAITTRAAVCNGEPSMGKACFPIKK